MAEVKERINEIMEDLRGRIRNPLILSFIIVWLYLHWRFVYILFTIDNSLPLISRIETLNTYITSEGWFGMIGKPILLAFGSLIAYYLIAILAQGIKVLLGKRLNAAMLAKFDTGNFALKSELKNEKNYSKRLLLELEQIRESQISINNENSKLSGNLTQLRVELEACFKEKREIEGNIHNNKGFIDKFELTLLFLLSKMKGIENLNFYQSETLKNQYEVINGNWEGYSSATWNKNGGTSHKYIFDGNSVSNFENQDIGAVENLTYNRGLQLLSFTIRRFDHNERNNFNLICINNDSLIGFVNNEFVSFKRKK